MSRPLYSLPFFLVLFLPTSNEDIQHKDLKLMEGTWTIAAMEADGEQVPLNRLEGTTLTVKGDIYSVNTRGVKTDCQLKLDPEKSPKLIDMIFLEGNNKDKSAEGIYEISEESFKIARGLSPGQARPEQFATWPKTSVFIITWKRQ